MSAPFDELTAKARLVPTAPYTQAHIDAAEGRLIARLAGNPLPHATSTADRADRQRRKSAAGSLRILCEAVLTRPGSLNDLNAFISQSMPEPAGARVLGSILHLAASYDSARSWWQYAAGAGDPAAAYCLYLHHKAEGEDDEAALWHEQIDATPPSGRPTQASRVHLSHRADDGTVFTPADLELAVAFKDVTVFDVLRILQALREDYTMPEALAAVLDYVPAAVGTVDDLDLPLPDSDFAHHIAVLAAPAPCSSRTSVRQAEPLPARIPERRRHCAVRPRGEAAATA